MMNFMNLVNALLIRVLMKGAIPVCAAIWSVFCNGASVPVHAQERPCAGVANLPQCVQNSLAKRWPETTVKLMGPIEWSDPGKIAAVFAYPLKSEVQILSDQENGIARIQVGDAHGKVTFQALAQVYAPQKRIYPNQIIPPHELKKIEVDLAKSPHRENRHSYLFDGSDIENLETKQSLFEGQPIHIGTTQPRPDVRRGDLLQVEVTLGDITLSTRAQVLENALKGSRVRIILEKQRRELVGQLRRDGVVEVKL